MSPLSLDQFYSGSGLLYAVVAMLAIAGLIIRGLSKDHIVRRRALLVVGLLLIFVILRVVLAELPPRVTGTILTPTGEEIRGLVVNPSFQIVSILMLVVGLLSLLLIVSILLVDLLLVNQLKFEIPNILRDVTIMVLFFVGVMMILIYQTDLDVAGLFTTSPCSPSSSASRSRTRSATSSAASPFRPNGRSRSATGSGSERWRE